MNDSRARSDGKESARRDNPFDTSTGYSGQDYHRDREEAERRLDPPGGQLPEAGQVPDEESGDVPPENGRRAFFDPATGKAHGSGSGAGGGNPGEDFDSDSAAGSGYPQTGAEDEARIIEPDKR